MFCPECGFSNPDGARFCGRCGKDLIGYGPKASASSNPVAGSTGTGGSADTGALHGRVPFLSLAIAAVAVVVLLVLGVTRCAGVGDAHTSLSSLMSALNGPYQQMIDDRCDEDSVRAYWGEMVNLMPDGAFEAAVEAAGYGNQGDLLDELVETTMQSLSSLEGYYDKVDVTAVLYWSDHLDEDELDILNDEFWYDLGLAFRADDGVHIGMRIEITALEDVGMLEEGEAFATELDTYGICAVESDGAWYLWPYLLG